MSTWLNEYLWEAKIYSLELSWRALFGFVGATRRIPQYVKAWVLDISIHQYIHASIHWKFTLAQLTGHIWLWRCHAPNTSIHQYVNASIQQYIKTSMHQCINKLIHYINTSIHQYINILMSLCMDTSMHYLKSTCCKPKVTHVRSAQGSYLALAMPRAEYTNTSKRPSIYVSMH